MSASPKASVIPPQVLAVYNQAKDKFLGLSKPARILLLSTTVFTVGIASYFGYDQAHEPYAVLFAQMDQDDAAQTVAKLKEMKTPYKLDASAGSVMVPESKAAELRLELAQAGLPRGGGIGFESFDKMKLGATEFEQHVLYRRSLEGELARSIGSLSAVQSARVHLVMPEKSVFVTRGEPASASVVLKLRQGRALGPAEVAGIVHLTAASVSGLSADRIAIVTTEGEMLKKPRGEDGSEGDDEREAQQKRLETQLEERARAMLERVVGAGHVDVRVTAEIDSARTERVEDHYDPAKTALRSEESSIERSMAGIDQGVAGVPGAESNVPGAQAPGASATPATPAPVAAAGDAGAPKVVLNVAPAAAAAVPASAGSTGSSGPLRETHTRNFEVDHVSEKRITNSGSLKRIAVAVVLDGVPHYENGKVTAIVPRDHAELERMALLVRSAVGASDVRGDLVTVDSVPFEDAKATVDAGEAPIAAINPLVAKALTLTKSRKFVPIASGAASLVALFVIVSIARRAARRRKEKRARLAIEMARAETPALPPMILEGEVDIPAKPPIDLRAAALERAEHDPATAALVLKAWLGATEITEPKPVMVKAA